MQVISITVAAVAGAILAIPAVVFCAIATAVHRSVAAKGLHYPQEVRV